MSHVTLLFPWGGQCFGDPHERRKKHIIENVENLGKQSLFEVLLYLVGYVFIEITLKTMDEVQLLFRIYQLL